MLICHGQGHSALIIRQFRTVHFLVNILFSGRESEKRKQAGGWGGYLCLVPLCLIIGACVNLGQRTGITDEWRLPPRRLSLLPLLGYHLPGLTEEEEEEGGGFGKKKKKRRMKRRVLMRAGTPQSSTYLSLKPLFIIALLAAPPPQKANRESRTASLEEGASHIEMA